MPRNALLASIAALAFAADVIAPARAADPRRTAIVEAIRRGDDPPSDRALSERPLAGGEDPTDDPKVASLKGPNR